MLNKKFPSYSQNDQSRLQVVDSLLEELKIMVKVESFRREEALSLEADREYHSQYVIQLLGCGLISTQMSQWPFLVIEYADVSFFSFKVIHLIGLLLIAY
jgi:hypothetical protein